MISNSVEMALVRTACQHHSPAWHAKGRSSESTNSGLMLTLCKTSPPAWNRQHNFCLFTCCKFREAPIHPHGTGSATSVDTLAILAHTVELQCRQDPLTDSGRESCVGRHFPRPQAACYLCLAHGRGRSSSSVQPRSAARCGAGCAPGSVQKGKAGAPSPFNAQACWPAATLQETSADAGSTAQRGSIPARGHSWCSMQHAGSGMLARPSRCCVAARRACLAPCTPQVLRPGTMGW